MAKLFRQRKGQSAIEYLTTYGWMLLVIAIVGGAIFTTVQGQTQAQTTSGLSNADVQIENWGVTGEGTGSESLSMELRNAAQDQVEITEIQLTFPNGSTTTTSDVSDSNVLTLPVGETDSVSFSEVEGDNTQDDVNVAITYNIGDLEDLRVNGTITGNLGYSG